MTPNDSTAIAQGPCMHCTSSDAYTTYSDGHSYCFSCKKTDGSSPFAADAKPNSLPPRGLLDLEHGELKKRRITNVTTEKFKYGTFQEGDNCYHAASYFDAKGELVAQKIRKPGKKFSWVGEPKRAALFGQNLWKSGGADKPLRLVITEGEIDAMSVSQVQNNSWPVVSVKDGAGSAVKGIKANLEFCSGFREVVLMFDMDEPGQAAAREAAMLFRPGQAKIANLPMKDASEMLMAGRGKEIVNAIWQAKTITPEGLVLGEELWEKVMFKDDRPSIPWPYECLEKKLHGIRPGDFIVVCAGTGIGKSSLFRELAYAIGKLPDCKIGYVALEESVQRSALGIMALEANQLLHLDHDLTSDQMRSLYDASVKEMIFHDHFGSMDVDNILSKIRYMIVGCDATHIFLDHLTAVVSSHDGDERKDLDRLVTGIASLAKETGAVIFGISHLSRPKDRAHEEGGKVTLKQLRGSNAIGQWAYAVIALERDQQADDGCDLTDIRVLKNRNTGWTGLCGQLAYDHKTGRMTESFASPFETAANSTTPGGY